MLIVGIAAFAQGQGYVSSPIVKAMRSGKFYMKLSGAPAINDADIAAKNVDLEMETATRVSSTFTRVRSMGQDVVSLSTGEYTYILDEKAKTWTTQPGSGSTPGGSITLVRQGTCKVNGQTGWYFDEYSADGGTITFYYNSDKVAIIDLGGDPAEGVMGPMNLLSFSVAIPSNMYFCVGRDWKEGSSGVSMEDGMAMAGIDRATLEKEIREAMKGQQLPPGMSIDDIINMALSQQSPGASSQKASLPGPPQCSKPPVDATPFEELACGNGHGAVTISGKQTLSEPLYASQLKPSTKPSRPREDLKVTKEGIQLAMETFLEECKGKTAEQVEQSIIEYSDHLNWALTSHTLTGEMAEAAIARCHVFPHPVMLNTTGTMLLQLDDPKCALSYFEKAEEYQPGYSESLYGQIECHLDMGNDAKAKKIVPKILEMTPGGLQDGRAWLYKALFAEDPYEKANALFKSVSFGYFDENSAMLFATILNQLDLAEMEASANQYDFMALLNKVFTPENLDNIRKGITWSRTEKFTGETTAFTATPAVNLESNWRMNKNYGEQYEGKGDSCWKKACKGQDDGMGVTFCMAMGLGNMGDNIQNIYDAAKAMPEVRQHSGNAKVAKTVKKLNVSDNMRSALENAYRSVTRAECMKYGVEGFYIPDDRAFWCLWTLERYYNYHIDYISGDFAKFNDDTRKYEGYIPDPVQETVTREDALDAKYGEMAEALDKRHEKASLALAKKCQEELDHWYETHPNASDSTCARAKRRIYKPLRIMVLVTHPIERLDQIEIPWETAEIQLYMDEYNKTFKPLYQKMWEDMSKHALYCHDPNIAKFFWFRALSEIYSNLSATYYAKATRGEHFEKQREHYLKNLASIENQDWKDRNAAANEYYQKLRDERDEKEFPKNTFMGLSDLTLDINLPGGPIKIGLVDGKFGLDIDTETKYWEKLWADYDAQVTGQKVKAEGTDNGAVLGFLNNVLGAAGVETSVTKIAETLLDFTGKGELAPLLKVAEPLDVAMKLKQGKYVEVSNSNRVAGYVRDSAGNVHRRTVQSTSVDFNGKLRLTSEIHQAGRIKIRKDLATYNSGGLFGFSVGQVQKR